jgi:hypothetical protein
LEDDAGENRKLELGFFCKQRLCPACAWRSSVRAAECISAITGKLAAEGRVMISVTLTVPNVPGDALRETVRAINRAWGNLLRRDQYKRAWSDYIKKLEITYNSKRDDYHPHLHLIVMVKSSYFKSRDYVSHKQLLEDWRAVTKIQRITQVDLRRCRDIGDSNAILEVAKYTAKASDYSESEPVFDTFFRALYGAHLLDYGGQCRALRDAYKRGELAEYERIDPVEYRWRVIYLWARQHTRYDEIDRQPYQPTDRTAERVRKMAEQAADREAARADRLDHWRHWLDFAWARGEIDGDFDDQAQAAPPAPDREG